MLIRMLLAINVSSTFGPASATRSQPLPSRQSR